MGNGGIGTSTALHWEQSIPLHHVRLSCVGCGREVAKVESLSRPQVDLGTVLACAGCWQRWQPILTRELTVDG